MIKQGETNKTNHTLSLLGHTLSVFPLPTHTVSHHPPPSCSSRPGIAGSYRTTRPPISFRKTIPHMQLVGDCLLSVDVILSLWTPSTSFRPPPPPSLTPHVLSHNPAFRSMALCSLHCRFSFPLSRPLFPAGSPASFSPPLPVPLLLGGGVYVSDTPSKVTSPSLFPICLQRCAATVNSVERSPPTKDPVSGKYFSLHYNCK